MSSRIWEPLEAFAKSTIPFGSLRVTVDVRNGRIQKLSLVFGEQTMAWTLKDVEQGTVRLGVVD